MFTPCIKLYDRNTEILYLKKYHSILEALEQNSITVDSQCRSGYCGTCRVLLIGGTVKYLKQPLACIKDFEILTCCCSPKSDIQLKIQNHI